MPCGVFKKDDDEYVSEAINVTAVPVSYWSYGGTYDTPDSPFSLTATFSSDQGDTDTFVLSLY